MIERRDVVADGMSVRDDERRGPAGVLRWR
jgi:hypothetical protein